MPLPTEAKAKLQFKERKLNELPQEELDKLHGKGMSLNNGTVYITRHGRSPPLPKLLREIKLKNAIEKQMQIYRRKQAEQERAKAREPASKGELLKAYEVNKPKVKPINPAKEIEAILARAFVSS